MINEGIVSSQVFFKAFLELQGTVSKSGRKGPTGEVALGSQYQACFWLSAPALTVTYQLLPPFIDRSALLVPFEGKQGLLLFTWDRVRVFLLPKWSGTSVTVPRGWQDVETVCKGALHPATFLSARQRARRT